MVGAPVEDTITPELPSVAARRMWYDTVGHGHAPALRCAVESFGADRLLLGTDFPCPLARAAVTAAAGFSGNTPRWTLRLPN
jgi:hypothetical protein